MCDVFVDPTDGCRSFVVVADVAHELARQILYGSKDTSRNNVALNLGRTNFDLVQPGGVGRGGCELQGWPQDVAQSTYSRMAPLDDRSTDFSLAPG